ncbi:MAG TPA: hypothetical protein VIX73_36690, partial [Kofleriaceae bacterium]
MPDDDAQPPSADGPASGSEADTASPPAPERAGAPDAPPEAPLAAKRRIGPRLIIAAGVTVVAVLVVVLAA